MRESNETESNEKIEDEIPPITFLSKSLYFWTHEKLYPDGYPYPFTEVSWQRQTEQISRGPIGLRQGDTVPEDWSKWILRWRRGRYLDMDFTPATFCRLHLGIQQIDDREALLYLSFENLWDEPILCYFALPHYGWWDRNACGLEAVGTSGEIYQQEYLLGITGRRDPEPSALCWIEPGRFYTHTERVVRRDDNQWHFCGKESDGWYWSAFSVPSQATYRLKWTYMGLPSNTIEWTAP